MFFQDLVNTREACEEVKGSSKFQKMLELILLIGNFLNSGSRNEQSLGFDINFLSKVRYSDRCGHMCPKCLYVTALGKDLYNI